WLPVCQQHRSPWLWRNLAGVLAILYLFGGIVGLIVLSIVLDDLIGRHSTDVMLLVLFGWLAGLIGVIILIVVVNRSTVRPTDITERRLVLAGVSPEFVDRLEDLLEPDPYYERKPARIRKSEQVTEESDDYPEPDRRIREMPTRRPRG